MMEDGKRDSDNLEGRDFGPDQSGEAVPEGSNGNNGADEDDQIQPDDHQSLESAESEEPVFLQEDQQQDTESSDPLVRDIEAVLFIAPEPVSLETLAQVTGVDSDELALAVEEVRDRHSGTDAGIVFTEVAGGYTFRAADASRAAVERFCSRPIDYSLSSAAMETLAIVAHLQPITRPEIARIRGIAADTVVNTLLDKGLLMEAGRARQGGAIQYRTTAAFEKLFGLGSVSDLPPLEGFEATPEDVEELRQKLYLAAEGRQ